MTAPLLNETALGRYDGSLAEALHTAIGVLATVEALPPSSTGALMYGDTNRPKGAVLLDGGRICWVFSDNLRQRLTDILRLCAHPPLTRDEMETVFQRCKADGTPVGQTLVTLGHLTSESLSRALTHHLLESLLASSGWGSAVQWVPHKGRGYDAGYTFTPIELFGRLSDLLEGGSSPGTVAHSLRSLSGDISAAAVERHTRRFVAVCGRHESLPSVRALLGLEAWAHAELEAGPEAQHLDVAHVAPSGSGVVVTWRQGDLEVFALLHKKTDYSKLLDSLAPRGIRRAVHSLHPVVLQA